MGNPETVQYYGNHVMLNLIQYRPIDVDRFANNDGFSVSLVSSKSKGAEK